MPAYKERLRQKAKGKRKRNGKQEEEVVDLGVANVPFKNKTKVLVFASRGITYRERHLMDDVRTLLPHSKKDVKLDKKDRLSAINEIADIKNCNSVLYFEERKHKDLYLWMARSPNGPSIKFHVTNIHTMDELKMTGNCLKGSRPILSFDGSFSGAAHLQLMKELFSQIFGVPKFHLKSKPFVDRVLTFSVIDNRIWLRNFQIVEQQVDKTKKTLMLAEIGPRLVLNPIKIFEGGFGGPVLYENPHYVSPNAVRSQKRQSLSTKYQARKTNQTMTKERKADATLPEDEVNEVFRVKGREV
mmetsp:Transcript_40460/g.56217  ORF Transcript_40460/g.56217 Transcript_40460/m.56217 type:complete len:300 (+) Transcript_40460:84-983(+)|eukprot:CAMPEP_0201491566 /NCGR_PEP_ID=MMETSP0151_2-20130828/30283_1 /ASSEMBLY_ACC=CAM_ASM_000257 /TAXON_ID=200890 /ORGANISM="Paramoeba atlantica, Strain 621/1 / CCAP 1560/9" /LENGTH=299 /DNA_ID=CAMNT_0047877975 /DNA_START=74 /DNA_END=973 /DNA_ORIENTATION=+